MQKLKTNILIIFGVFLLAPLTSLAYDMPRGIPDPGFGLDEVKPVRPSNWTSEQAGYYYVEDTGGCSNSRTYGYPGAPRCYIPDPIPAGSYVEVHGTYNHTVGGTTLIHGEGTANSPVWIVGESDQVRPTFTENTILYGS